MPKSRRVTIECIRTQPQQTTLAPVDLLAEPQTGSTECFLCQYVCHVLREHHLQDEFIGPRFLVNVAALEMHPLDEEDRLGELKEAHGIGYCNITKCCTEFCPGNITITDNAIIPLKEQVTVTFYDPLAWLWRSLTFVPT